MRLSDIWKIRPYVRKTHSHVIILERKGIPFYLLKHRSRHFLFWGALLSISLLILYSKFIWEIDLSGNESQRTVELINFLEKQGIQPGILRSHIQCEDISEEIRKYFQNIVWVSTSIDGSHLKIQMKENSDLNYHTKDSHSCNVFQDFESPKDLVATKDGMITSIVTRHGIPCVHVGDVVKKGEVLVSGRMEVWNDMNELTQYEYCTADADIYADTTLPYKEIIPSKSLHKTYKNRHNKYTIFVQIKDKKYQFGAGKQNPKKYDKTQRVYRCSVGKRISLPMFFGKIIWHPYMFEDKILKKEEINQQLEYNFHRFLEDLKEKGIQIYGNDVKIHVDENSGTAQGNICLNESITEAVNTETLEIERNEQNESIGTDD